MGELKIAMGIWGNTNLADRFNVNGFGDFVPVLDRIKQIGELEGINGFELHLPTEINDSNADDVEKIADDYGLQMVQLGLELRHPGLGLLPGPLEPVGVLAEVATALAGTRVRRLRWGGRPLRLGGPGRLGRRSRFDRRGRS